VILQIWETTSTAKRMQIDPYCQQRNCSPLNVLFSGVNYIDIVGRSSARVYNQNTVDENDDIQPLYAISRKQ